MDRIFKKAIRKIEVQTIEQQVRTLLEAHVLESIRNLGHLIDMHKISIEQDRGSFSVCVPYVTRISNADTMQRASCIFCNAFNAYNHFALVFEGFDKVVIVISPNGF